ncbi:hypothetical protein [Eggerthella guodeyinii]|uniref:Nucleotidyl transferase AbiEii/AbiGii toxin family protein n=1 Tax=Eggerthella guodeyinii TaxID=2690837 RepID=A0A6N7RQH0_9ACTN|nr:hypothetical protein [Eggerthella guodeyinii]MRX83486.1 hypothetical protein [Eggerthella guodeyinii]
MVAHGVRGLDRFKEHMAGLEDSYVVIGGTACEVLLGDVDLEFRATKDIDMVLLVEGRLPEAAAAVWRLVRAGGYRCGWKGSARAHFYRFTEPSDPDFPVMIELFSAAPDFIDEDAEIVVAPLPVDDEVSSLSAILLDEDYYRFMKEGREVVDGIAVLGETRLIPFKAKAFLDLSQRKELGEHVDSRDLRKHKNDVLRLAQILKPGRHVDLVPTIRADMSEFCDQIAGDDANMRQLGISASFENIIELIRDTYRLD